MSINNKSISTSNRSIKSSTKSGNIVIPDSQMNKDTPKTSVPGEIATVSDESPNEQSTPQPTQLPGSYDNEGEPLLRTHGRPSHRSIGQPISDGSYSDEDETRIPLQNELYGARKDYRIFIHNSKVVLNILIFINTLWLVLTFVSDFFFNVNALFPYSNRIGSFNDLTLIFIAIISNALSLWFNRIGLYSVIDQGLNVALFALTSFNLLLTLLTGYTRKRIGFMGTFTYLWVMMTFLVGAVLDWYLYQYNKKFYSQGEDDSPQTRHTLKEWISIGFRNVLKCVICAFFIMFTLNTLLYTFDIYRVTHNVQESTTEANSSTYDAFHWIDKEHTYQLHIKCYGDVFSTEKDQQPILLYEHGGMDTAFLSATWIQELYHLNRVSRYCTYERPGYGLSDSAPAPVSIAMVADALSYALVHDAKIKGPFVPIGYDLGGLFSQVFTAKNLDKVDAMLLVESWHEDILLKDYLQRLLPPDDDSKDPDDRGNLPPELQRHNGFIIWWRGIWSTWGIKLQTSWLLAHHGSKERIMGRDMQYQGKFLRAKFLESVTSSMLSYKDVLNSKEKLHEVKTSVVSSNELIKKSPQWGNWQRELTKISSKTQEWKIVDGGHEIYKYGLGKQELQDVLLRLIGDKDRYIQEE